MLNLSKNKEKENEHIIRELHLNRNRKANDPYLIQLKLAARKAGMR